ncbi:hypothetical protein [Flavobacterium sp.]|uniref:hypothetical protein n=1 Tax=Flavobacterium sp. TaxID=239 RepID=UPI0022C30C53|nr:hypothetical protein [Flavobacterium sp.]MCZ8229547.1 hypothetical protein [Flavobacterium sp.]
MNKENIFLLVICLLLLVGCQVTETIVVNADGSGQATFELHRVEQSYQLIAGEEYNKNEAFEDTTYVFDDYIKKYDGTFSKLTPEEKAVFNAYKGVQVHIKKNSFEKEFRTTFKQDFLHPSKIADLYKTQEYVSDIVHNYALSAEEHYYKVSFEYSGNQFKRVVTIISEKFLKKNQEDLVQYKSKLSPMKLHQKLTFNYHFPKKIQSVSVANAKISPDQKSVEITFDLLESLINPESTAVTVEFE